MPMTDLSRQSRKQEELLRRLRFPRVYMSTHSKIWWIMKHTPLLLITLVYLGVRYLVWRMLDRRTREKKGVVVKSRIGRFFHEFVAQRRFHSLLKKSMQPWGFFHLNVGVSMQPTFAGNPTMFYPSYAYIDTYDVSPGDVVAVLGPRYDDDQIAYYKRTAAVGSGRIWVSRGLHRLAKIVQVRLIPPIPLV